MSMTILKNKCARGEGYEEKKRYIRKEVGQEPSYKKLTKQRLYRVY